MIRFDRVTLGYGRKVILRDVSLSMQSGDYFGLVGPNGAGKTTLLRAILGTLKPQAGTVTTGHPDGRPLRFGYVPQRDSIDSVIPYTARDVVMMGRYRQMGLLRFPGNADDLAVMHGLHQVGVEDLARRVFRDLSGGQKQRVLIARALASNPDVLVLDEPTNGMDLASRVAMLDLIDTLHVRDHLTVIMVSHLLDDVANHVQHIALVESGFFQVGPVEEVLTGENLSALYHIPVQVESIGARTVVTVGGRNERR
jgi:manganese/zinc/iron transport system ATP- binding protein